MKENSSKWIRVVIVIITAVALFPVLYWFLCLCMVYPRLAFIPVLGSLLLALVSKFSSVRRSTTSIISTATWFLYALWEHNVAATTPLESVPIRIDLLLLFPILYVITFAVIYSTFIKKKANQSSEVVRQR